MRIGRLLLVVTSLALAAPAAARDRIDYDQPLDALLGDLAILDVEPPSDLPPPIDGALILENIGIADHETIALSWFCREEIENPAGALVRQVFAAIAPPEPPSDPAATVTLTAMSSSVRCLLDGDTDHICIAKATIRGSVQLAGANDEEAQPIWAQVERPFNSDGMCARRIRGVAYVTREAVVALAARARAAIAGSASGAANQ